MKTHIAVLADYASRCGMAPCLMSKGVSPRVGCGWRGWRSGAVRWSQTASIRFKRLRLRSAATGPTADSWKQRIWFVRQWVGVRYVIELPRSVVWKPPLRGAACLVVRLSGGAVRPRPAQHGLAQAEGVGVAHVVDPAADGGVEGVGQRAGDHPPAIEIAVWYAKPVGNRLGVCASTHLNGFGISDRHFNAGFRWW